MVNLFRYSGRVLFERNTEPDNEGRFRIKASHTLHHLLGIIPVVGTYKYGQPADSKNSGLQRDYTFPWQDGFMELTKKIVNEGQRFEFGGNEITGKKPSIWYALLPIRV